MPTGSSSQSQIKKRAGVVVEHALSSFAVLSPVKPIRQSPKRSFGTVRRRIRLHRQCTMQEMDTGDMADFVHITDELDR
jgi:hypothetical protein